MVMKVGGKGKGAGAAAAAAVLVLVLLVTAAQLADAAVARRLIGTGGVPVDDALSGPKPNSCTNDPNNSGQTCHGHGQQQVAAQKQKQEHSSPAVSVSMATSGRNPCTHYPKDPTGKKCHYPPPLTAP